MAAAATNVPAGSAVAAVLAFLQAATAVFACAWSRQSLAEDDDEKDPELVSGASPLAEHGDHLRAAVAATEEAKAGDVPTALLRECVKIGKDIGLRLDRLAEDAAFTWELADLVVLGERLDTLVQRAQRLEQSPFPVEELHQLERQLVVRLAPNAPALDEFYNGEPSKADGRRGGAKEPRSGLETPTRGPRGEVAPEVLHDFILEALAYKSMRDREDEVTEAHASTFDWVFADGEHGLKTWLSTADAGPVYWITGKPGSGKSTFMRHLSRHEATARCLGAWGGGTPVLVAGFFFWTGGAREQRSRTGLLRSLLHQLLSARPGLAAAAFPALWARLQGMSTKERVRLRLAWTAEELLPALHALVAAVAAAADGTKTCLFVDGMDEFEGDHAAVVDLFRGLATAAGGRVKMCLSSRPWEVFRDAFAFTVPNLRLQELTRGDMRRYVSETLARDGEVGAVLERDEEGGARFVDELVDRADGVFLWVRLAVEKILERSAGAATDGVDGLARLLATLPADLDALFAKLLFEDQTPEELAQTAAVYGLMRTREEAADFVRNDDASNLTVWELAFALDKADDQMVLDKLAVEEAKDDFVQQRAEATIETIQKRFSGLLDLHVRSREGNLLRGSSRPRSMRDRARARVVYIHRTVRDWLLSGPGVQLTRPADLDPDLRLLRSYVLQMKRPLGVFERHRFLDDWWPGITLALTHARRADPADPEGLQRAFVNELDATVGRWWLPRPRDPRDHWARAAFGTFETRAKAAPIGRPFLCLAVRFGLRAYVAAELAARRQEKEEEEEEEEDDAPSEEVRALRVDDAVPLLAYATEFSCSRRQTVYPASDPALVETLLRADGGEGPDSRYRDFATRAETTTWLAMLRHLRDARRRRWIGRYDVDGDGTRRWARVVRLLLEVGGADPRAVVKADAWDPEITAEGVMEMLDETYNDVEIRGLRDLLRGLLRETGEQPDQQVQGTP
ncbi:hypothetical protein ISF_02908 [Cordyceps fumosorosea ARSEF 2679]|uniref:NACHT domain-containing protein n=1 Tax=Cordyceps fumosorosea (strain ARSEF 2679) TaxID=1081104 RepID=A0A168B5C0_CORFA|nr:hypothetical protein ISF_02908 [Cordyceps fumosorosea ARSEF 2679]OAA69638.1 hypothetical protein ISF_02908 [Cordyceps fumosorosea ARSEF 2679]